MFFQHLPDEYDDWFQYTWNSLIKFLSSNGDWFLRDGSNLSIAKICNHNILLQFNNDTSLVPINISTNRDFMDYTNARTREKVFSKWIKNHAIYDQEYKQIKGHCSYVAGERLSTYINENYCDSNIYEFFQIYPFTYYYAKTTSTKTSILRVPSQLEYNNYIVFEGCHFIAHDQLNLLSTFRNTITGNTIQFRNECRFSHGQFNGTPEAKMYIVRDTPLTALYIPIE